MVSCAWHLALDQACDNTIGSRWFLTARSCRPSAPKIAANDMESARPTYSERCHHLRPRVSRLQTEADVEARLGPRLLIIAATAQPGGNMRAPGGGPLPTD